MTFLCARIAGFSDKLSRFEDLKNTVDRGSAENFGPDSELCMSRSSDCGSEHLFSVGLGQYFGVFSTNFFSLKSVRKPGIKERSIHAQHVTTE